MPQIAQQDYEVIAPKPGRVFSQDAAALGELKKAILNGIGFDCLVKNTTGPEDGDINRILGFYEDVTTASYFSHGDSDIKTIELPYTVTQYQGLAAVQNAVGDAEGAIMTYIPELGNVGHLEVDDPTYAICVDGKYLTVTGSETIEALAIAETGPTEDFINITWEDAQKLIGLPLV